PPRAWRPGRRRSRRTGAGGRAHFFAAGASAAVLGDDLPGWVVGAPSALATLASSATILGSMVARVSATSFSVSAACSLGLSSWYFLLSGELIPAFRWRHL